MRRGTEMMVFMRKPTLVEKNVPLVLFSFLFMFRASVLCMRGIHAKMLRWRIVRIVLAFFASPWRRSDIVMNIWAPTG